MIRQLTGNLGVDRLLHARAGAPPPPAGATERAIAGFAALGVDAVEEYLAWALLEPAPGRFDWSAAQATAAAARAAGLGYVAFPWLHVVPDWFAAGAEFVPMRCLEHGGTVGWPSPFAPATGVAALRLLAALRDALGGELGALCLAFPADYGEVGFPTGFGAWASPPRPPHDHVHAGFWLGDEHARAAWRRFAASRGLPPEPEAAAAAATSGVTAARRGLAEFAVTAVETFLDPLLAGARALFPALPLWLKVGHGGECPEYGIDVARLARLAARHGAGLRTTQATLPTLHQQRIGSACRVFAVPLGSEPPLDVGRARAVARLFDDAAAGVTEAFDYAEQLVAAADLRARFGAVRTGRAAVTDIAVHFSRAALLAQPHVGLPPQLHALADALRDRADFAVVDGELIAAGALAGTRLLALTDPVDEPPPVQAAILRAVAAGATLLVAPEVAVAPGPLAAAIEAAASCDAAASLSSGRAPPAAIRAALGTPGEAAWLGGEWHAPEDAAQFQETPARGIRARWSGAGATITLPRPPGARTLLELEAWVHPRFAPQRVVIEVDGAAVGTLERCGLQRFAAWLPASGGDAPATVAIAAELRVPSALGLGPDRRALGVAVIWARLTAEGASAAHALAIEHAPPTARVDVAALARYAQPCGTGRILRCGSAPFSRFLALFAQLAASATDWGAAAPRDAVTGELAPGVRLARFAAGGGARGQGGGARWLAFQRGAAAARLVYAGNVVEVAPGLLAELP